MVATKYPYIVIDDAGVPLIEGTRMKVTELVVEKYAYAWSPEELHLQHPYLGLGQIHAALAYYWDHCEEMDEDIARRLKTVQSLEKETSRWQSSLTLRLKDKQS